MKKANNIRDFKNGNWYWVDKLIVQKNVPKIGTMSFTVYSFLASLADKNQSCFPSQKYIAESIGCSRSTVNKAIKALVKYGLIIKKRKDRYHCTYSLIKVRCRAEETQMSHTGKSDVTQRNTNDNKRIRNNNNNNIDKMRKGFSKIRSFKEFTPRNREELIAVDLADTLDDYQGLPFYISLAKKYPETFLRRILEQVMQVPQEKIKKSRGALFNHLVQKDREKPRLH
jgi:biotin operon repressor